MTTITDTERIEFLESLKGRTFYMNPSNPSYHQNTDIHITGGNHCSLYARAVVGSQIEFSGYGETIREMIDDAMEKSK